MEKNPRHLGLLQKVYEFCEKYRLSHDVADTRLIMHNGLRTMALENRMDSITNKEEAAEKHYVEVSVYYMNEFMTTGPFTPEQLNDLANIGTEIKFASK